MTSKPRDGWYIDGFLPKNELGIIFGQAQSGKTALAIDAVLSCLMGSRAFGKLATEQVDSVLFVNQDMNEDHWQQRIGSVYQAKSDGDPPDGELYAKHHENIKLDSPEGRDKFKKWVKQYEPDIVIIDSLTEVMFEDPAKHVPVKNALGNVKQVKHDHPCTIAFLAHMTKDGEYYGSQHNRAGVDFTWLLEHKPSGAQDVPDQRMITRDKARGRQTMYGFVFELGDDMEGVWRRARMQSLSMEEEENLISAIEFARQKEEEGETVRVSEFVKRQKPGISDYRARKAFKNARKTGMLELLGRRGKHGRKLFELTEKGYEWFDKYIDPVVTDEDSGSAQTVAEGIDAVQSRLPDAPKDMASWAAAVEPAPESPPDFFDQAGDVPECEDCQMPTWECVCDIEKP
jgi:hypothetical protein